MNYIDDDHRETALGQHDRWLRQAPDLFEAYTTLQSVASELATVSEQLWLSAQESADYSPEFQSRMEAALAAIPGRR